MPYTPVQTITPSYLYQQYSDDENIQAWVTAYNELAQGYLNWFNYVQLPVYTSPYIAGNLLNWVTQGIYGITRPSLQFGGIITANGPYNSFAYNTIAFNRLKRSNSATAFIVNDDIYKRIITWNFFRGDGNKWSVRYLKRRIMRFLNGVNGTAPNIDNTYPVSVTFGVSGQVDISFSAGATITLLSSVYNYAIAGPTLPPDTPRRCFAYNSTVYNQNASAFVPSGTPPPMAPVFKAALLAGALQFPFQFTPVVTI